MEKSMFVKNLVEENGETVEQNNMKIPHNIPIDTLVETEYVDQFDDDAYAEVKCRAYVFEHERDFDGTPMYTLAQRKKSTIDWNLRNKFPEVIARMIVDQILVTGIPEGMLTVIK